MNHVVLVEYCSFQVNNMLMLCFQKVNPVCTLYLFMELSFHVHYMCVAKTINKWWRGSGCGLWVESIIRNNL